MKRRTAGHSVFGLAVGLLTVGLLAAGCTPRDGGPAWLSLPSRAPAASAAAPAPPARGALPDETLARMVRERLDAADRAAFTHVFVLARDGAVLLTGAVVKPGQRRQAAILARETVGSAPVYDDLRLTEPTRLAEFDPDPAGERRLAARLTEADARVTVRVVRGVAYLVGTARDGEAAARAADRARDEDGIAWVVSHVETP